MIDTQGFLESVILKIDFEKIANFEHDKFFELMKDSYPEKRIEARTELATIFSPGNQALTQRSFNEYKFYDESLNLFCVSESYAFFELKKHIGFDALKMQFEKIFRLLTDEFNVNSISRIGLRYVNNIDIKRNPEITNKIAAPLLSNNQFFNDFISSNSPEIKLSLSLAQMSFKNKNTTTNFVFGNPNSNYPAVLIQNNFLLDYDSFSTTLDTTEVLKTLNVLHENISFLFKQSLARKSNV